MFHRGFFTITANEAGWPDLLCELLALEVRARDFLLTEQELTTVVQVLYNYIRDKPELKKRLLMRHPVAVARNFEKRVEHLLDFLQRRTDIVGEIKDYYVRFEFQERGSAHAHALFWVAGCPSLHAAQEEASKLGLDLSDEDSEDDDSDKGAENNEEMDKEEENPADIVAEDYVEQPGQPADEVPLAADVQEDAGSTDEDCERCPADGAEREADSSSETDSEALPEQAPEETTAQEDFRWYTEQLQRAERKKPGVLKDMLTYIDAHVTCFRPTARYVKKVQRKLSRARSSGDAEAKALLVRLRRLQKRRTLTNLQSHVCVPGYCYHRQSKKPKCRFGYPQKCRAKTGFTGGRRMYSLRRLINERTTNGYSWPILSKFRSGMDLQCVVNAYGAACYILGYTAKAEMEAFNQMLQRAMRETDGMMPETKQQVYAMGSSYCVLAEWACTRLPSGFAPSHTSSTLETSYGFPLTLRIRERGSSTCARLEIILILKNLC